MTEAATLNGQPPKTVEEKLCALEAKFAALEKGYQDLYKKSFPFTESESASLSIGTITAQVCGTISDTNNSAIEDGLNLQQSSANELKGKEDVS